MSEQLSSTDLNVTVGTRDRAMGPRLGTEFDDGVRVQDLSLSLPAIADVVTDGLGEQLALSMLPLLAGGLRSGEDDEEGRRRTAEADEPGSGRDVILTQEVKEFLEESVRSAVAEVLADAVAIRMEGIAEAKDEARRLPVLDFGSPGDLPERRLDAGELPALPGLPAMMDAPVLSGEEPIREVRAAAADVMEIARGSLPDAPVVPLAPERLPDAPVVDPYTNSSEVQAEIEQRMRGEDNPETEAFWFWHPFKVTVDGDDVIVGEGIVHFIGGARVDKSETTLSSAYEDGSVVYLAQDLDDDTAPSYGIGSFGVAAIGTIANTGDTHYFILAELDDSTPGKVKQRMFSDIYTYLLKNVVP